MSIAVSLAAEKMISGFEESGGLLDEVKMAGFGYQEVVRLAVRWPTRVWHRAARLFSLPRQRVRAL